MRSPTLDPIMEAGHWLGSVWAFVILALVGLVLHASRGGKTAVWRLAAILVAGWAAIEGLRRLVQSKRPDMAFYYVGDSEMTLGFPSRSVFLATVGLFVVASALESRCRSWKQLFSLMILVTGLVGWVAFSQLYLLVHFVTDVIAGLLAGMGMALLCRQMVGEKQSGS